MWSLDFCFARLPSQPVHPGRYPRRPRLKGHRGPWLQHPPGVLKSQPLRSPLSAKAGKSACRSEFRWSHASAAYWSSEFVAAICLCFLCELFANHCRFGWCVFRICSCHVRHNVLQGVHMLFVLLFYVLDNLFWIARELITRHRISGVTIRIS